MAPYIDHAFRLSKSICLVLFVVISMAIWSMNLNFDLLAWHSKDSLPLLGVGIGPTIEQSRKCAPWLQLPTDRRVAFVSMATMKDYYEPHGYKGGEFYMTASLDYALRLNGFHVDTFHSDQVRNKSPQEIEKMFSQYHRVFTCGIFKPKELGFYNLSWPHRCKYRTFEWWGTDDRNGLPLSRAIQDSSVWLENSTARYNHRQFLLAFPGPGLHNTFLGFFPHSLLWQKEQERMPNPNRNKVVLFMGKTANKIKPLLALVPTLLENGFEIHTTCGDCDGSTMANLTLHKNVGPFDYIQILKSSVVLIGSGDPLDSPSPLEGLANGVAFLNPILNVHGNVDQSSETSLFLVGDRHPVQHAPFMFLGSPYVYNVRLDNHTQVLEAAMAAFNNRFASFVPPEYRIEAIEARVCSILEDDALCTCSNPVDCWGSSVVRNTYK